MALSSVITWEVRTTGSDTQCAGGFKTGATGTDYSQQTAAQFSGTDLVIDATTNTKVTSATHNFVAADVGNLIQITAGVGYTTGFYEIVSVASNAATLDRSPGAVGLTGGTWWEGGALASPGMAGGAKVAGNQVWIKAGTYTITSTTANVAAGVISETTGGSANVSKWEGYNNTRGDLGTAPVIQVASSGVTSVTLFNTNQASLTLVNVVFDGLSKTSIRGIAWNTGTLRNVTVKNCTNIGIFLANAGAVAVHCAVTGCSSSFAGIHGSGMLIACEAYSNTIPGIQASGNLVCVDTLSYNNSGASSDGFFTNGAGNGLTCINCTAYGNGRDGFRYNNTTGPGLAMNCVAEANSGWGFSGASASRAVPLLNCATYNNTTGGIDTNFDSTVVLGAITGSVSFFVAVGSANFALNAAPTGGGLLHVAGYQGPFPTGTTTGYLDVGACQSHPPPFGAPGLA